MDEKDALLLQKIISIIYCRSISSVFRKPLDLIYPEKYADLTKSIKYPMDLGTLLLAAMKRKMKITNYRDGLRLVFTNAVTINKDIEKEINLAKHLDSLACRLYEDNFQLPYRTVVPREEFIRRQNSERMFLINLFRDTTLKLSEMLLLVESLNSCIPALSKLHDLREIFKNTSDSLQLLIQKFVAEGASVMDVRPTIWYFLHPVFVMIRNSLPHFDPMEVNLLADTLAELKLPAILILLSEPGYLRRKRTPIAATDKHARGRLQFCSEDVFNFMQVFDQSINTMLTCIYERTTRGNENSTVWATPLHCALTVEENRPVIVLTRTSSSSSSSSSTGILIESSAVNISRLPENVRKELNTLAREIEADETKLETITDCLEPIAGPQLDIPPGYSLVEYLDDHEFGWLTMEDMKIVLPSDLSDQSGKEVVAAVVTWMTNRNEVLMDNYGLLSKENELVFRNAGIMMDESIPSADELERSLQRSKPDNEDLTVGEATLSAGIHMTSSSSSSSSSLAATKVSKDRAIKTPRIATSRKVSAKPISSSSNLASDTKSDDRNEMTEEEGGKAKVYGDGEVDGVPLHQLYQKGLFLASRCPRDPNLSKREASVQRCKFFGAWADNHRALKEGTKYGMYVN